MERNRKKTEEKFIDAVHSILKEEGYGALGVNAIAEKAGMNKVLLYRYFGSVEGLLEQYVNQMDPFPDLISIVDKELSADETVTPADVSRIIFSALEKAIGENPSFAEMLKWEIVSSNPLTKQISETRERNGVQLTEYLKKRFSWKDTEDIEAVLAIVTGGLFYLWLRGDSVDFFNNVPINKPEGRERLLEAATAIIKTIFS